jgi:ADP-ribosylglycohydrolase
MLHFLENKKAGLVPPGSRTSMESDSFMVAMPLAALQACREEQPDDDLALARVVSLVNAHELNGSQLIMPTLCLLREVIRSGHTVAECLDRITANSACPLPFCNAASVAVANLQRPHSQVSDEVGSACANPASLTCGLHAALSMPKYTDAIRAIAFAGGCSCSR